MDANRRKSAEKFLSSGSFNRFIRVYWRSFAVDLNSYTFCCNQDAPLCKCLVEKMERAKGFEPSTLTLAT